MLLPEGEYSYALREHGRVVASETAEVRAGTISGSRRAADGLGNRYEAVAELDDEGRVRKLRLRYERGPFARSAVYEAAEDLLLGSLSTMGGREHLEVKLGRFREADAGLIIFKALLIAHVRARGQQRWTGRVAVVNPATLLATSVKQTLYQADSEGARWILEPAMGERETLQIDDEGRLLSLDTRLGAAAELLRT